MAAPKKASASDVELHPDGWQRFERAMAAVVKAPPQHRVKAKAKRAKSPAKTRPSKQSKV
jgi:hypothetical protein